MIGHELRKKIGIRAHIRDGPHGISLDEFIFNPHNFQINPINCFLNSIS